MKASKSKSTDADSRLEEAALLLEEMARDLRRLKKRNGETKVPAGVSSASDAEGVQVGSRVYSSDLAPLAADPPPRSPGR